MKRCSEFAYAMCPDRAHCGSLEDAVFMEGSECAAFNRSVEDPPMTNADRIRSMSDAELSAYLNNFECDEFAHNYCDGLHCTGADDDCDLCCLQWLKQPAKEG